MISHKQLWDELGAADPYWAVLTDPGTRGNRWDPEAFFERGTRDIAEQLGIARELGVPARHRRALDYGCGLGRITQALARQGGFDQVIGLDISTPMVETATKLHADLGERVAFQLHTQPDLSRFADESFDLVWCVYVLQHQPSRKAILQLLGEFARVLAPDGLLIVQLPTRVTWRGRVQSHRRLYPLLRGLGVPSEVLLNRLHLSPMAMTPVPVKQARTVLKEGGLRILRERAEDAGPRVESAFYYATK